MVIKWFHKRNFTHVQTVFCILCIPSILLWYSDAALYGDNIYLYDDFVNFKGCIWLEITIQYFSFNSRWQPSDWSACSVTCGVGQQTRKLMCVHEISPSVLISVVDNDCLGLDRPNTTQPCKAVPCFKWATGRWSQVGSQILCSCIWSMSDMTR